MDTVILAAGKGTRLEGLAVPYHKPLLVVSGKPLVTRAVDLALEHAKGRVIVVTAPENTLAISQILGDRDVYLVVQREAHGPGNALHIGMKLVSSPSVLVLMADNLLHDSDVQKVVDANKRDRGAWGVRFVDTKDEAARFTRITPTGRSREGRVLHDEVHDDGRYMAWVGPLALPSRGVRERLPNVTTTHAEVKIGPWLSDISPDAEFVLVDSYDIGVPEALV